MTTLGERPLAVTRVTNPGDSSHAYTLMAKGDFPATHFGNPCNLHPAGN